MVKIPDTFNFGDQEDVSIEELIIKLKRMYFDLAVSLNRKPDVYQRTTDGQTTDTFLSNGDITINLNTNKVQMVTNHPSQTTITLTTLS